MGFADSVVTIAATASDGSGVTASEKVYVGTYEPVAHVKGDVNEDKNVDISDIVAIIRNPNTGTIFQGVYKDDEGYYSTGIQNGFRLVLPEAVNKDARKREFRPANRMNNEKRSAMKFSR